MNKEDNNTSVRQSKVAHLIKRSLAQILSDESFIYGWLKDGSITVTNVIVAPDLRNVTVFFVPFGKVTQEDALKFLQSNASKIRYKVSNMIQLKYSPKFSFKYDKTFDTANTIDVLLAKIGSDNI
jgi:ribosome-binding factor A